MNRVPEGELEMTKTSAEVNELQAFTGWSYEHTPEDAVREALEMARRRALIAGFSADECVLLYVNATRLGPACYAGDAGLRCAR